MCPFSSSDRPPPAPARVAASCGRPANSSPGSTWREPATSAGPAPRCRPPRRAPRDGRPGSAADRPPAAGGSPVERAVVSNATRSDTSWTSSSRPSAIASQTRLARSLIARRALRGSRAPRCGSPPSATARASSCRRRRRRRCAGGPRRAAARGCGRTWTTGSAPVRPPGRRARSSSFSRLDRRVDEPQLHGLLRPDRPPGQHQRGGARADGGAEHLERRGRERHADLQLRDADRAARHQPVVARLDEDAPAGDRVAVHGRHGRPRVVVERQQPGVERQQELLDLLGPAVEQPLQVDAGGERAAGAGEDDRVGVWSPPSVGRQRLQQLEVQHVHLAVLEADDGDSVVMFDCDHGDLPIVTSPAPRRRGA